jgi:hypothetical protein
MPAWLYDAGPQGLWVFVVATGLLGGLAALATGRALAQTWRPLWHLPLNMLLLACGVRFIHYAIFGGVFLSVRNLVVDFLVLTAIALFGYLRMRQSQMLRQYGWIDRN